MNDIENEQQQRLRAIESAVSDCSAAARLVGISMSDAAESLTAAFANLAPQLPDVSVIQRLRDNGFGEDWID